MSKNSLLGRGGNMRRSVWSLLLVAAVISSQAISSNFPFISQARIYMVHSAVFDAFVPFKDGELNTTIKHLLGEAKNKSFGPMASDEKLRYLLFLLDNPARWLHSKLFLKWLLTLDDSKRKSRNR